MKKLLFFLLASWLFAEVDRYRVPPTSTTTGYVPVISDEMMKKCVEVYNDAQDLDRSLSISYVNQYSSKEVNAYNAKVRQANQLNDWYNRNCAGKWSKSACEQAKKLNIEKGLPYQECN